MKDKAKFESASAYQEDILALPVKDLDDASKWYGERFGMKAVDRQDKPHPTIVLERDEVRIGFATNGKDASQDGAAILVSDIQKMREEFESNGVRISNWRIDEMEGVKHQVFFVVAPDGLCYYFHQPI